MLQDAQKQGLPVPAKPASEIPTLPDDITEVSDSRLMRLFRDLMGWQKYLGTQLALAEVDEKYATRRLNRAESDAVINAEGKSVTEKKAAAKSSPFLVEAVEELDDAYAYRKLVESLHDGVEKDTFLCSRELSRRLGTRDRESRDARYTT